MTREIKFRAWDKEKKEWIDMSTLRFAIDGQTRIANMPPSRYDLLQYTGLKDKNSKEIYEGDILGDDDTEPLHYKMVWLEDECRFELEVREDDEGNWSCGLVDELKDWIDNNKKINDLEIIGNIYENPELLTNK